MIEFYIKSHQNLIPLLLLLIATILLSELQYIFRITFFKFKSKDSKCNAELTESSRYGKEFFTKVVKKKSLRSNAECQQNTNEDSLSYIDSHGLIINVLNDSSFTNVKDSLIFNSRIQINNSKINGFSKDYKMQKLKLTDRGMRNRINLKHNLK